MKKINTLTLLIVLVAYSIKATSQVPTAGELLGLHSVTESQMNSIAHPIVGTLLFNSDDNSVYEYNGTSWESLKTTR